MASIDVAQRVADELEIRNLLAQLTYLADTVTDADIDDYLDLHTSGRRIGGFFTCRQARKDADAR